MPPCVIPPAPTEAGCHGCSRRTLLRGLAITAAGTLLGCRTDDEGPEPGGAVAMCGTDLCLDLDDPENAALATPGGALTVAAPRGAILLVRTSDATIQALSGICTHAGCGVRYDPASQIIVCPCHGSRFSLTGAVIRGPASRPLAPYTTQLDLGTNALVIVSP